ncbi:MAG: RIP metalloprotease RseP [Terriglobia bacterium]|jgi:regulator of sigma E protease
MAGSFITDAVVVVLVLGLMIFVHELGHFLAAKFFGVRVLVFSLGFGKRLLHLTRGDTDYRISALPFGGYVKMAGDDPSADRQGDPGEFLAKPRWQRFVVVVMGPIMNILLALVLLTCLYKFHYQKPAYQEQPARVGDVEADSPASQIGLMPGDFVVRLDSLQENPKWEDVEIKILTTVGEAMPLEVERDGKILNMTLTPRAEGPSRVGYAGLYPYAPGVVDKVEPGLPASHAGLIAGDQIVGVGGRKVLYWPRVAFLLQSGKGKPVQLSILRDGREFSTTLTPALTDVMGEKRWRIGVSFHNDMIVRMLPWGTAIGASLEDNLRNCLAWFDVMGKILTRRLSTRSLAGPIGIAQLSGEAYRAGLSELVMLVCFISLNLGLFNLLPIPVLDGGVILLLLIEGLIRRDLSVQVKEKFVQVGFLFLLLLVVFLMCNDIVKTIRPY